MTYLRIPLIIMFLALLDASAFAQFDGPPDGPPDGRARERLEELRRLKMVEALKLDEEQAVRLTVRERKFRESEKELREQRTELLKELQDLIEDDADDAALKAAIENLSALSVKMTEQRQEYVFSLQDILSMEQIARLVIFEHRFAEEVRRIIGNARRKAPMRR